VLLSADQEYLMTFKLMTSQVVQRAGPLITHICVVGIQRVNLSVLLIEKKITSNFHSLYFIQYMLRVNPLFWLIKKAVFVRFSLNKTFLSM